jgi:AAA+ superfamily predicted ATPase
MTSPTWTESNQKYLTESIDQVKVLLEKYRDDNGKKTVDPNPKRLPQWTEEALPALEHICTLFGLSAFERSVLLLCAGVELNGEFARLCAEVQGNPNTIYATFGLALAAFPHAHWSAITPAAPLRRFKLIELYYTMPPVSLPLALVSSPLRIEERVLHYLVGIFYFDPRLHGFVSPVREDAPLVQSHKGLVQQILLSYKDTKEKLFPLIQLWGVDLGSKLAVTQQACAERGLNLWQLPAEMFQTRLQDTESFVQLWSREFALLQSGLYISAENVESSLQRTIKKLAEDLPGPVFLGTLERWSLLDRKNISLEVKRPAKAEQLALWRSCLNNRSNILNGQIPKIVNQFDLNASAILSVSREAELLLQGEDNNSDLFGILWNLCLETSRTKMELVHRLATKATMDDLVLPDREKQLLHEIIIHVVHRTKVYEEWGFGDSTARGLGITALFSGASGTGKTMAAEVLANALHLDLFCIDLSTVVSKYIGETEKNLRKVFDSAEEGGAVLFFDEADALFGKRTEVRDSHDRYANIEVNYLLQRMESYSGLAILATNMKSALDSAFLRRIRFIIEFPFPDEKRREEIWRRIFPSFTPLDGIDFRRLARLNVSGGNIRNIAMKAAFLAAEEEKAVNMRHLKRAAQTECMKLERPMTQAEVEVWE